MRDTSPTMDSQTILAKGRRCFEIEIAALAATSQALDGAFVETVQLLLKTLGNGKKLLFSGIGKNQHICEKLVGTFNSIGVPSCFLDPVRALHGDLGLCQQGDALLAFSNKGETEEILRLVPQIKRFDVAAIGVTANAGSSLARLCDIALVYQVEKEACPLDLAPTASTTTCMALGDALAMVLLECRAFGKEDFARFHPGGSIGRQLATRVDEIMRTDGQYAILSDKSACRDCLRAMTETRCGCAVMVDGSGALSGILTDGDIRRLMLSQPAFLDESVALHMTRKPIVIASGALAAEALKIFESHRIDDLVVVDAGNRPIGVIDGQDLTKARVL